MPRGDRGGTKRKKRPPPPPPKGPRGPVGKRGPTPTQKQATIWAAEQRLLPWEAKPKLRPSPVVGLTPSPVRRPPPPTRYKTKPTGVPLAKRPAQDGRYKLALAAPVSREAREALADTMTPQRRRQVIESQRPYPQARKVPLEEKLAGRPLAKLAGWATPSFLGPVDEELKEMASVFPSATRAILTAVVPDAARLMGLPVPRRKWGTPGLAKDLAVGIAQDIERYTPIQPGGGALYGPLANKKEMERDIARMKEAWKTRPLTGILTVASMVLPPARAASVGRLATQARALNPGLTVPQALEVAIKESYRPGLMRSQGLRGGLERELVTGVPGGREVLIPGKPLATTPVWRAAQRAYDKTSRRIDPERRVVGKFSERRRAVRRLEKLNQEHVQRVRLDIHQTGRDLNRYARGSTRLGRALQRTGLNTKGLNARMAALTTALQGPPGEVVPMLTAAAADLRRVLDEGGKEIPTEARLRVEKQIERLDDELRDLGLEVRDEGHWVDLRNTLHEAGWRPEQIDAVIDFEKHAARRWAKQTGEDPTDYLAHPLGANIAAFAAQLPDDLTGLLFQRAGWNVNLMRLAHPEPIREGDLLFDTDGTPMPVLSVAEDGAVTIQKDMQTHTVSAEGLEKWGNRDTHISMRPGQRVASAQGELGTVESVALNTPEGHVVRVTRDDGTSTEWPLTEVLPPGPSPFRSKAEEVVLAKMQNKAQPEQLLKTLENNGVKAEEIDELGLRRFVEEAKASGKKSVTKDEVLTHLRYESGHKIEEVFRTPDSPFSASRTRYPEYTTTPNHPGYREILFRLGGPTVFTGGHWMENVVAHVRFFLEPEEQNLHIAEIQSDWWNKARDELKAGRQLLPRHDPDLEKKIAQATQDLAEAEKRAREEPLRLLGIPESEWGEWQYEGVERLRSRVLNSVQSDPGIPYEERAQRILALKESPEYKKLEQASRIEAKLQERARARRRELDALTVGLKTPPMQKWREMVLKRMIALAVENDFKTVSWDGGRVHAVRYGRLDVGGGGSDYDMSDWEYDNPRPDESDYSRMHTSAERDFAPPTWPEVEQLQLPGMEARDILQSGQMDEFYPRDEHGTYAYEPYDPDSVYADTLNDPTGKVFEVKHGPLEGQLVQVVRVDETGMTLRPSGLTRIELRGMGEDTSSSYGEVEVTTEHVLPGGEVRREYDSYSDNVTSISNLRSEHFLEDEWLDELQSELHGSEDWITDDDAYADALDDWEQRREYAEESGEYSGGGLMSVEEINEMPAGGDDSGLIPLYEEMLPNEVQKLLKKYNVRVEDSGRWGTYNTETSGESTEEGMIASKRFEIPEKLAEDIRKGEGTIGYQFQRRDGEIRGASATRPDGRRLIYLLENGNVDTFLHELVGHGTEELSARFPKEWAAVEKAIKKPLAQWTEVEHERFAKWTERYFREGKAPTPEVEPLLRRLRQWMRQVYESILLLGRPIPPEARELLDRFLGKTEGGKSVFDEREQEVLRQHGEALGRRKELLDAEGKRFLAQPDEELLEQAQELLKALDPDKAGDVKKAQAAYSEIARRRYGSDADHMDAEEKRLLERQVGWLEDAIKEADDPEGGFTDALAAVVSLSEQADDLFRRTILDMAPREARPGMERALDKRRNLLVNRMRERGLLPYGTGDALGYFPHASIFESLGEQLTGPVRRPAGSGLVLGKPRVTKTAGRRGQNKLILWQSGKVNMNPKVLLNTVLARLRLLETREARDALFNIGRPVKSEADVPQGWWVINREGKHIPERLRRAQELTEEQMDELVAAGEDFDSYTETKKGMDDLLEEYRSSFARPRDEVPPEWYETGELRAVPPDVVEGLLPKPFQAKPGGALGGTVAVANALARLSTILQYPAGYILSNVPANLIMQALTKPSALFRENPRALTLRKRNRRLYNKIAREAGDIMAEAGLPDYYAKPQGSLERGERKIVGAQRWAGERLGEVSDTPFRVATYLAWARKYGITSDADLQKLIEGEGNLGELRDQIMQRTRDDMLDFNSLSQTEREVVSRYFFLWALQKALLKWPITFARDHPVKALALSQFADEEMQEKYGYGDDLGTAKQRSWRHLGLVPVGDGKAVDISSLNPVGGMEMLANMGRMPEALTRGDLKDLRDILADMSLPQIREVFRDNPSLRAMAEATIPGAKYVTSSVGDSRGSKIWKREDWWDYMLARNTRFHPEEIDAAQVKSQAERERRKHEGTTKAQEDLDTLYDALPVIAKRSGYTDPAMLKRLNTGIEAWEYVHSRVYDASSSDEKVELVNDAVRQFYPRLSGELHEVKPTTTEEQKERYYAHWRDRLYGWHNWALNRGEELDLWTVKNGQLVDNADAESRSKAP